MGRSLLTIVLALGIVQLAILPAAGQAGQRTIRGKVYFRGGEVATRAAVQLEDEVTLAVISQMTDGNGRYHFNGLNPDRDYQVTATKRGLWSKSHRVSRFSSRPIETVVLYLEPNRRRR